jgi:hypothetical protein
MLTTTRVTTRFRDHLLGLRRIIDKLPESPLRESLDVRLDLLSGDLAMGFPVTEEVELEPASPGDLVVLDVEGLLADTEPHLSAARDNRISEVA